MIHINDRGESNIGADMVQYDGDLFTQSNKHLSCSLRVTDIMYLLGVESFVKNIFEICGYIVASHILECEIPKIKVSGIVGVMNVVFTVSVSTRISDPDIISSVGKVKNGRFGFTVKKSATV
jgi:hypothetical protein